MAAGLPHEASPLLMKQCPGVPPSPFVELPLVLLLVRDDGEDDEDNSGVNRPPSAPTPNVPEHAPSPPHSLPSTRSQSPDPIAEPLVEAAPPPSPIGVAARRRARGQTTAHRPVGEWWNLPKSMADPPPEPADSESEDDELLLQPGSALIVAHEGDPDNYLLRAANYAHVQLARSAVQSGNPRTYYEALRRADAPLWEEAAISEIRSLLENCTWDVVDCPAGVKPIRSQ